MSGGTATPVAGRRLVALCCFAVLLGLCVAWGRPAPAGAAAGGALVAEPVLGAAAAGVTQLFGPTPDEAPGEVWGVGTAGRGRAPIVRHTDAGGWEEVADPVDLEGRPVSLTPKSIPRLASAGRTTPRGGVAVAATLQSGEEVLLVRDPGGVFRVVPAPAAPILAAGPPVEHLFARNLVRLAVVDEANGKTGVFVVPSPGSGSSAGVLHYDGTSWAREAIEGATSTFAVIAIDASESGNVWLLGKRPQSQKSKGDSILLLRRSSSGEWHLESLGPVGSLGALFAKEETTPGGEKAIVAAREKGQALTVTSAGVWVDATVAAGSQRSDATIYYDIGAGQVTGSWCDLTGGAAAICAAPLGSDLSSGEGRSFAWPPGPGEPFGRRAITGVGQGAMLIFEASGFARIPLAGNGGGSAGAALSAPDQGWLGPSYRLTRGPVPSGLQPWPVPFRRPLTAVAAEPGQPVADLSSQALAVGDRGQVARYLPGQGWQPESLLTGAGKRATPNLRGVAWPRAGLAFAVGDDGAMWLWRASSGFWEPDPGAPPNLIRGNFTGVAFDPSDSARGFAVGKQGLLLRYGRRWTQEPLPPELNPEVNFTSVAFAGSEALATYTLAVPEGNGSPPLSEIGGVLVNDGSGWRIDESASEALAGAEAGEGETIPRRVAGLPDGGAVVAGAGGGVILREASGAPWHTVSGTPVGYPAAVAAIREGGQLRAILSVEANPIGRPTTSREVDTDFPQAYPPGGPPLLTEPYPLPSSGYLVRQTASGWRDEQRQSYPAPARASGQRQFDLPRVPDATLALLISPDGSHGWAVGGSTGEIVNEQFGPYLREGLQSGSAMRYGSDAAPPANASTVSIPIDGDQATFAVGGGAVCVSACADLGGTGIGPDIWLRAAVGSAATIRTQGLRAFLYTGDGVAASAAGSSSAGFREEQGAYARRLSAEAGSLPVFAAPSQGDRFESSLAVFGERFGSFLSPLGSAAPPPDIAAVSPGDRAKGNYSYAFDSAGTGGTVRVIVLDYSVSPLSLDKQCWLAEQLATARPRPAIVLGSRPAGGDLPLRQLLVTGANAATDGSCPQPSPAAASAYLFSAAERNMTTTLSWGDASIDAFGTGTLGYTQIPRTDRNEYVSASGYLLVSVDVGARDETTNVAPVTPRLIPSLGTLAIDALDGTLLRRSQPALFNALARRPTAGVSCVGNEAPALCDVVSPDSYLQIPARCINRASCASEILPEYSFSSSRPDIADFVKVDPLSTDPRTVFLDKSGKPVADPTSGLLCAFNAGTTTITVQAGGLTYSTPVTVQAGSVQRPCGTVPLRDRSASEPQLPAPVAPFPNNPAPGFSPGPGNLPPPPPPPSSPSTVPPPPALPQPASPPFFLPPLPTLTPIVPIVPPTPPATAQTTPPSGTSPVTQAATSPQPEEEEEQAIDVAHHMAAYRAPDRRSPSPAATTSDGSGLPGVQLLPVLVLMLALAGAGMAGPRRDRSSQFAPAIHTTSRRARR